MARGRHHTIHDRCKMRAGLARALWGGSLSVSEGYIRRIEFFKRDPVEPSVELRDEKSRYSIAFARHVAVSCHSPADLDRIGYGAKSASAWPRFPDGILVSTRNPRILTDYSHYDFLLKEIDLETRPPFGQVSA